MVNLEIDSKAEKFSKRNCLLKEWLACEATAAQQNPQKP
jgi:hypothetical protein